MTDANTFEQPLHFHVRSGNRKAQYHLIVKRASAGLNLTCTYHAARRGRVCRHRLRLVDGDETLQVGPREHLPELSGMISNTLLPKAVQELRRLERERDLIAQDIKRQEQFIVELMSG